jgi:hypothetical protein
MNKKNYNCLLDMYDGVPNQGMRCIIDIITDLVLVSFNIYDEGNVNYPKSTSTTFIFLQEARKSIIGDGAGIQNTMLLLMH